MLAARALRACTARPRRKGRARDVKECIQRVADALRNTPAVCRRSYVHPAILEAYMSGALERVRARSDERLVLAVIGARSIRSGDHASSARTRVSGIHRRKAAAPAAAKTVSARKPTWKPARCTTKPVASGPASAPAASAAREAPVRA